MIKNKIKKVITILLSATMCFSACVEMSQLTYAQETEASQEVFADAQLIANSEWLAKNKKTYKTYTNDIGYFRAANEDAPAAGPAEIELNKAYKTRMENTVGGAGNVYDPGNSVHYYFRLTKESKVTIYGQTSTAFNSMISVQRMSSVDENFQPSTSPDGYVTSTEAVKSMTVCLNPGAYLIYLSWGSERPEKVGTEYSYVKVCAEDINLDSHDEWYQTFPNYWTISDNEYVCTAYQLGKKMNCACKVGDKEYGSQYLGYYYYFSLNLDKKQQVYMSELNNVYRYSIFTKDNKSPEVFYDNKPIELEAGDYILSVKSDIGTEPFSFRLSAYVPEVKPEQKPEQKPENSDVKPDEGSKTTSEQKVTEDGHKTDYIKDAKGWTTALDGNVYWYEDGYRQGYDIDTPSYRGKEIYDASSNAWYWLDNVQQGAIAKSKDVFQESKADDEGNIGKWVRYDADGHMIKGWCVGNGEGAKVISGPDAANGKDVYYFDLTYGTMYKGSKTIDGVVYYFDENTGIMKETTSNQGYAEGHLTEYVAGASGWKVVNGQQFWYENGLRQGFDINDRAYRGKEIFDPDTNAWYWLDNVDGGKKAVSKDVYQESLAGVWGDKSNEAGEKIGKWVRYDANGLMIKGWCAGSGADAKVILEPTEVKNTPVYYFDLVYGTMAKGTVIIDGVSYTFDEVTGILVR